LTVVAVARSDDQCQEVWNVLWFLRLAIFESLGMSNKAKSKYPINKIEINKNENNTKGDNK
jgi:hypothetical protein